MNLKTAKRVRKALAYHPQRHTTAYAPFEYRSCMMEVKAKGGIELHPAQRIKPIRLKEGSPRRVYKVMKRLERTVGLDNVVAQLAAEAGVPA